MHYPAHVRFVDAHAERNRRDDDFCIVVDKRLLIVAAFFIAQARMVGQGGHTIVAQLRCEFIDALAG